MQRQFSTGIAVPMLEELERHAGDAERLLRVLANRHRLMVLCALADSELSVGALNERVPLSQSALSQHLAVLREDGLVETRREAQTIYYSVADGPALDIIRVLHGVYCGAPAPRRRTSASKERTK
jgi:DNA-binding transcriptional ArsR family regulator